MTSMVACFLFLVALANSTGEPSTEWSGVQEADANFGHVLRTVVQTVLPSLG
jgi:hypothetical protein